MSRTATTEKEPSRIATGADIQTKDSDGVAPHYFIWGKMDRDGECPELVITNFVMEPTAIIYVDGDEARTIFEVRIGDKRHQLPSRLFSNVAKFREWCNARQLEFTGNFHDLAGLYSMLNRAGAEVPRLHGVDVVGLHGGSFVLPEGVLGKQGVYAYVPPEADPTSWTAKTKIIDRKWDGEAVETLARLHHPEVMTPLLGWIAAAPFRSRCIKFPPLVIAGTSGFGKSTLLETVLSTFGFWTASATNITGTTPHAVQSFGASSNALPVWLDEFRPGGRDDTMRIVEQMIRDAWDGSSSRKAGWADAKMEVRAVPARAPLIISGEDATFSERSQVERAIIIDLPADGKDFGALADLQASVEDDGYEINHVGLGHAYLSWVLDHADLVPPTRLDRAEHGRAIVRWGYGLLRQFMVDTFDTVELPDFDESLIKNYQKAASLVDPYLEAVQFASNNSSRDPDGNPIAWESKGVRWVRSNRALHAWAVKAGFKLPGGPVALTSMAMAKYGALQDRRRQLYWPVENETPTTLAED